MYSGVQWPCVPLYNWSCLYTNDKKSRPALYRNTRTPVSDELYYFYPSLFENLVIVTHDTVAQDYAIITLNNNNNNK